MSRIADEIREYVKDPESTGVFEYGAWGILRKDQRAKIRELCDACDIFEQAADNFGKELMFYKRALKRACESVGDGIVYKDIGTNKELNAEELEQMFMHQVKKEWENELKEWKKSRYNAS